MGDTQMALRALITGYGGERGNAPDAAQSL
jgi:hypothetical protein